LGKGGFKKIVSIYLVIVVPTQFLPRLYKLTGKECYIRKPKYIYFLHAYSRGAIETQPPVGFQGVFRPEREVSPWKENKISPPGQISAYVPELSFNKKNSLFYL